MPCQGNDRVQCNEEHVINMITETCFVYLANIYYFYYTRNAARARYTRILRRNSLRSNQSLVSVCSSASNGWLCDGFPLSPPQHFNFNGRPSHRILPPVTSLSPVCLIPLVCFPGGTRPSLDVTSRSVQCIDMPCLVYTIHNEWLVSCMT